MTFYVYKDARGEHRWYLVAGNNRKIADSGEGYQNEADCVSAIRLVMGTNSSTPIYRKQ